MAIALSGLLHLLLVDAIFLVPPVNLSFSALNVTLAPLSWPFSPAPRQTFVFTSTCCGYGNFTPAAVATSAEVHGIWDVPCLPADWPILAEWGYEFMKNQKGPPPLFPLCANLSIPLRPAPPSSREQAVQWLNEYWSCRAALTRAGAGMPGSSPIVSEIGHYMFSGLSVLFPRIGTGTVLPGSEIGENINSINFHVAATRGAARAGAAPWLIDFSSWMAGFITDYTTPGFWGPSSSPVGGHSPSLMRRSYYYSFVSGAGALVSEAGAVNFFLSAADPAPFPLSPLGLAGADFSAFTRSGWDGSGVEAARGLPYAPVAIVLPVTTGVGLGWFYSSEAWDLFPLSEGEQRVDLWLRTLWPGSFTVERDFGSPRSESGYLVSGPWGEGFDIVLASADGLRTGGGAYRALIFVGGGEQPLPCDTAQALVDYVARGGFLLLNGEDVGTGGCFPTGFLGLDLHGSSDEVGVVEARDTQTGWIGGGGGSSPPSFCAPDDAGEHWYIKDGGDPGKITGWDGGREDKCCSTNPGNCLWFSTSEACTAALPRVSQLCRVCSGGEDSVGCPQWGKGVTLVNLTRASISAGSKGQALFTLQLVNGTRDVLGASVNSWGKGVVSVLLAPGANAGASSGLNLTAHLLDRLVNDTAVFSVRSNVSSDGTGGKVATLSNRMPWGWMCTLINSNGVVKQPSTVEVIDPSAGRHLELTLKVPSGEIRNAWVSSGGDSGREPLSVATAEDGSAVVFVEVEAGGLRVVGFLLEPT